MKTTTMAVAELKEDPDNLRTHPEANLAQIAASLAEFGQPEPLVVRQADHVVISGNGRLAAMRRLGWQTAEVVVVDWDAERARAYSLVANRTAQTSEWRSMDAVYAAVDELADTFQMNEMGFEREFFERQIEDVQGQRDEAFDPGDDAPKPKPGKSISLTQEQRGIFDQACTMLRESLSEQQYSDGRCLELFVAEYLAGA